MQGSGRTTPVVLSIAGSDCSGGAGIQADLKTCSAIGAYCATILTAVTAQNPYHVSKVQYVGDEMLARQLEAIFEALTPDAVKIGMVPCASAAKMIYSYLADYKKEHKDTQIVIDPVLRATSGKSLSSDSEELVTEMKNGLFGISTLLTPNLPELYHLCPDCDQLDPEYAARRLMQQCRIEALLIKGGHSEGDDCNDLLIEQIEKRSLFQGTRIDTEHTHGTGCTLSSAISAYLSLGMPLHEAVGKAKEFVTLAIARGRDTGLFRTNGPVMQF